MCVILSSISTGKVLSYLYTYNKHVSNSSITNPSLPSVQHHRPRKSAQHEQRMFILSHWFIHFAVRILFNLFLIFSLLHSSYFAYTPRQHKGKIDCKGIENILRAGKHLDFHQGLELEMEYLSLSEGLFVLSSETCFSDLRCRI